MIRYLPKMQMVPSLFSLVHENRWKIFTDETFAVFDLDFSKKLLTSISEGFPIGEIVITGQNLVDGRRRLSSIRRAFDPNLPPSIFLDVETGEFTENPTGFPTNHLFVHKKVWEVQQVFEEIGSLDLSETLEYYSVGLKDYRLHVTEIFGSFDAARLRSALNPHRE